MKPIRTYIILFDSNCQNFIEKKKTIIIEYYTHYYLIIVFFTNTHFILVLLSVTILLGKNEFYKIK